MSHQVIEIRSFIVTCQFTFNYKRPPQRPYKVVQGCRQARGAVSGTFYFVPETFHLVVETAILTIGDNTGMYMCD